MEQNGENQDLNGPKNDSKEKLILYVWYEK